MFIATRVVRVSFCFSCPSLTRVGSKGSEALDNPEHRYTTDGVGRDEFGPARKWNADLAREGDQRQQHADEQKMAGLDAQAEEQ